MQIRAYVFEIFATAILEILIVLLNHVIELCSFFKDHFGFGVAAF